MRWFSANKRQRGDGGSWDDVCHVKCHVLMVVGAEMPVLVEASLDSGPWSAPRWFTLTSDKGLKWPWCAFSIYFTLFLARDVGAFFLPVVLPSGWAWLRHVKSGYRVWLRRIIHSIAWYCNTDGDGVIAHSIVGYQRWLRRSTNSRSAHAPLQHQRSVHLFSPKQRKAMRCTRDWSYSRTPGRHYSANVTN